MGSKKHLEKIERNRMRYFVCICLVTLAAVQAKLPNKALDLEWDKFITKHAKHYKNPAEEFKRY